MLDVVSASLLLATAACLAGCGAASADPAGATNQQAVKVPGVTTVHVSKLPAVYRASATVRGRNTAIITSKLTAYIRSVDVRAGEHVEAGQTLAVLDAAALDAEVRRERAGLRGALDARDEAESARDAADSDARVARLTFSRAQNMYRERAMTRQELDDTQARYERAHAAAQMAAARVQRAASQIDEARAQLTAAQAARADARLVAPFAGRVVERHIDPGSLAAPGTPLLVIDEDGPLRVDASVDESQAPHIHVGDAAQVTIGDGAPIAGEVSEIVPAIDPASRSFIVKVTLPGNGREGLQPGMFARVAFRSGSRSSLAIPASAVVESGALDQVFVLEDGRARLRLVSLGERAGDDVEVLSGLAEGEQLITKPPPGLRDGQRIEVGR